MSFDPLIDLIHQPDTDNWKQRNEEAFAALLDGGRYPKRTERVVSLRAPDMKGGDGVPFAAYIDPSNPGSGPYGGLSFVVFPVEGEPCLIGLVVGTNGLSPDEAVLGRPGHTRKVKAICEWLNRRHGKGALVAWAKHDPTRTDVAVPDKVRQEWSVYKRVFERYGREMYGMFRPPAGNRAATRDAAAAMLDLYFEERGIQPLAASREDHQSIQSGWFDCLMPDLSESDVVDALRERRYVIVQGPPGTGKTRMALGLLQRSYRGNGESIQFHPNTTYENFVGGLAPTRTGSGLGLEFSPAPGSLMRAAQAALANPSQDYLLHIDEINRADLSKVLGEAIFLFESQSDVERKVGLPYDFGPPFGGQFFLPKNLHVLGTMNSADRSIAIVDVAVRRRFAFLSLWPSARVVEENGCGTMQKAFRELLQVFVEHAGDDTLALMPGHSYFLERDEVRARKNLRMNLYPLLEEYLTQGYVSGFAEPVRGYLQWVASLQDNERR